jgi:hypothetical protein
MSAFDDAVWKVATENFRRQTFLRRIRAANVVSDNKASTAKSKFGHAALRKMKGK